VATLQPFNFTTPACRQAGFNKKSVLREDDLSQHRIPKGRSVTHGSEAKGKQKMSLYA